MPNVILDANVLVSAAIKPASVSREALRIALLYDTLCISSATRQELVRVLSRPKFSPMISESDRAEFTKEISNQSILFTPQTQVQDCRDPKDDKYLDLALAANAAFIVSGDSDLLILDPWRGVRIVTPADYVRLRTSQT